LAINSASAQKENSSKINFPQQKVFSLPDGAVQIDDSVYKLPQARDPKSGELVEGFAIVHRKNPVNFNKPAGLSGAACYGFLATGAKWKVVEPWLVNPANNSNLAPDFILNNLTKDIGKWEDAADGVVGNDKSIDILGVGTATTTDLSVGYGKLNGKNEVYFASLADNNTIAITYIWGIFSGSTAKRQLVEWDQVYNTYYSWSDKGAANKMDFEDIATHELGHAVGMNDLYQKACNQQTMYGYASLGEIIKRTLEIGDINGISILY